VSCSLCEGRWPLTEFDGTIWLRIKNKVLNIRTTHHSGIIDKSEKIIGNIIIKYCPWCSTKLEGGK